MLPFTVNHLILQETALGAIEQADKVHRDSTLFGSLQHPIPDHDPNSTYFKAFDDLRSLLSLQPTLFGSAVYEEWIPFPSDETLEEWVTGSGCGVLAADGTEVGPSLLASAKAKMAAFQMEYVKAEPVDESLLAVNTEPKIKCPC